MKLMYPPTMVQWTIICNVFY